MIVCKYIEFRPPCYCYIIYIYFNSNCYYCVFFKLLAFSTTKKEKEGEEEEGSRDIKNKFVKAAFVQGHISNACTALYCQLLQFTTIPLIIT